MELQTTSVTWVLEAEVFPDSHAALRDAIVAVNAAVLLWRDDWLESGKWPRLSDRAVVFHGSLGNADAIAKKLPWRPGSFCDTEAFRCSSWYPRARPWLLHRKWDIVPANDLVADPLRALVALGNPDSVFVRPDSPLKPFSGRVLSRDAITLRALDHGFYYDDATLPVVVAPVQSVGREWRYVVVNGEVVAGSAYDAERRAALPDVPDGAPWRFAADVATQLPPPQSVYVLDVCEADGDLRLVELNPFSGADLYACDRAKVVEAVSQVAAATVGAENEQG